MVLQHSLFEHLFNLYFIRYVCEAQYVDNEHLFLMQYLQCIQDSYVQP